MNSDSVIYISTKYSKQFNWGVIWLDPRWFKFEMGIKNKIIWLGNKDKM
jgi:hypothetical protein